MCRCTKFFSELIWLDKMREIIAGPNLPKRKSVYDMEADELELFKKEVKEWEKTKD